MSAHPGEPGPRSNERTLVVASNLWYGSPSFTRLTDGARALDRSLEGARVRLFVSDITGPERFGIRCFDLYRNSMRRLRAEMVRRAARRVLLLGGGCAAASAAILYLRGVHPDLAVIWVDAHADFNTPDTSPSKYIHGMALRILCQRDLLRLFYESEPAFESERVILLGQKEVDPPESAAIERLGIRMDGPEPAAAWRGEARPVYVHIDLDSLHPRTYLNPKCAVAAGYDLDGLTELLRDIARIHRIVGMSIAENFETEAAKVDALIGSIRAGLGGHAGGIAI